MMNSLVEFKEDTHSTVMTLSIDEGVWIPLIEEHYLNSQDLGKLILYTSHTLSKQVVKKLAKEHEVPTSTQIWKHPCLWRLVCESEKTIPVRFSNQMRMVYEPQKKHLLELLSVHAPLTRHRCLRANTIRQSTCCM
jgi:hypothetical protein